MCVCVCMYKEIRPTFACSKGNYTVLCNKTFGQKIEAEKCFPGPARDMNYPHKIIHFDFSCLLTKQKQATYECHFHPNQKHSIPHF